MRPCCFFWWKTKRAVYKVASLYLFQKWLIAAINCYELYYFKFYARCWNILSKIGLHKDYRPLRVSNLWIFTVCREIVWFIMYICVQQWLSLCDGFTFFAALCPSHITSSGWGCGFQINCSIYEPGLSNSRLGGGKYSSLSRITGCNWAPKAFFTACCKCSLCEWDSLGIDRR